VPAEAGATSIRLASTAGLAPGQLLFVGTGSGQETATIASIVTPNPAAPAPNLLLTAPLANQHAAAAPVLLDYQTVAVRIDTVAPVAAWPQIVDGTILQSQTLTPTRTDPRRRDPADTANGSGGAAIRRMEVDGRHVIPMPLVLNKLTVGKHTQSVALQDIAGNALKYTQTFAVTTSFDDLDTVLGQLENNALSSTLSAGTAAGATGIRLAVPYGFRAGQQLVIGSGADAETATIAAAPSPPPAAPAAQLVLSSPLALAHAAGVTVANPRPVISAGTAGQLRALLSGAEAAAAAGRKSTAIATLLVFNAVVRARVSPPQSAYRSALTSAGEALIDQVRGRTADTRGTGIRTSPWTPVLRQFPTPTPFAAVPGAKYKVLVNGQARGFRHEHIVQTEWLIQKLGQRYGFDVEIWDPDIGGTPGLQAPDGVSLTENPLLDLNKLMQYKTLVFASTVGRGAQGLNPTELANLQAYIRAGGGFVAQHGAVDSMQDVPWYMDLVGAGFTNHGSNAGGIMPDCGACGEVELINVDPNSATTGHLPGRFTIHDELYNTTRNPAELGIVHPLILENEATLVGQLGYSTGTLMNSDQHAMAWCRNFDGGRSFTTVLGHSWALMLEPWYQQMILRAIQTTAGRAYANCVTYAEVADLLAASVAAGSVTAAGGATLGALLAGARTAFEAKDYRAAVRQLEQFQAQTKRSANGNPAALRALAGKAHELIDWAEGLR
jgi:type 1 glutamine amidotransferase